MSIAIAIASNIIINDKKSIIKVKNVFLYVWLPSVTQMC